MWRWVNPQRRAAFFTFARRYKIWSLNKGCGANRGANKKALNSSDFQVLDFLAPAAGLEPATL